MRRTVAEMQCCVSRPGWKGLASMKFADHMDDIFTELTDLSVLQRHTIKERYRFLMDEYRTRCRRYAFLFYVFRMTVTVGSLTVPALLSIQNGNTAPTWMYWLTWGISLAVTTSNGIMTLFKLDKRFFMLHATAERLRSETWQYIHLAGRYSGHYGPHNHKPTHGNQYVYYCSQLEKINMKRVDEEYVKTTEEAHHAPAPAPSSRQPDKPISSDTMVPSPADQSDLKTPGLNDRDSISIVEDYEEGEADTQKTEKPKPKSKGAPIAVAIAMPMPGSPKQPVQTQRDAGSVLPPS